MNAILQCFRALLCKLIHTLKTEQLENHKFQNKNITTWNLMVHLDYLYF